MLLAVVLKCYFIPAGASVEEVPTTKAASPRSLATTAPARAHIDAAQFTRARTDSLSSAGLSDFYEAFDFLDEDEKDEEAFPAFYKVITSCNYYHLSRDQ